jgi:outer membrane protein assembly factor BamD
MRRFACALLLAACATEEGAELDYAASARQNYLKGKEALADDDYTEATGYFTHVKNKYPFSKYAAYAELRIADTDFAEGKYAEAVSAYRIFLRGHPTHPEVENGYTNIQICECYVLQMPDDWVLAPPAYEKDQASAQDALRELRDFVDRFAKSRYIKRARRRLHSVLRRLADHELYVARFYLDRDQPRAAAGRLEGLLLEYPEAGSDPEVLLILGETYLKAGERDRARATFTRLAQEHEDSVRGRKAVLYLRFMDEGG